MTKTAHTNYIERVKKGQAVYAAMEALGNNEFFLISFGNRGDFKIMCHEFKRIDGTVSRSYTISDTEMFGRSMNIHDEKSGKSYLFCYSYDLFSNETHSKLYFEHITILFSQPHGKIINN